MSECKKRKSVQTLEFFHVDDTDFIYEFACNQCKQMCSDFRVYCKYCEKSVPSSWDYDSYDLCVDCFQRSFLSISHPHPRESFAVEKISFNVQTDIIDKQICGHADFLINPSISSSELKKEGQYPASTLPKRNLCAFCHLPHSIENPFIPGGSFESLDRSKPFYAHYYCAKLSPEVYQLPAKQQWVNVAKAFKRGRNIKCSACHKSGATLGCWDINCKKSYHIACCGYSIDVLETGGIFWCPTHRYSLKESDKFSERITCDLCHKRLSVKMKFYSCKVCTNFFNSFDLCTECFKNEQNSKSNGSVELHDLSIRNLCNQGRKDSFDFTDFEPVNSRLCHPIKFFQLSEFPQKIVPLLTKRIKHQEKPKFTYGPSQDELFSLNINVSYYDIPGKVPRWATHFSMDFPGTWIPQLVRWAVKKYTTSKCLIVSNFIGRGTDAIECFLLGRNFLGFDCNPEHVLKAIRNIEIIHEKTIQIKKEHLELNIALNKNRNSKHKLKADRPNSYPDQIQLANYNSKDTVFELLLGNAQNLKKYLRNCSVRLVLSHPPYFNCIPYSNSIRTDFSQCKSLKDFKKEVVLVAKETRRILIANTGRCFLMIGDTREQKFIVPVAFSTILAYIKNGFCIEEIIIKRQRACSATANGANLSILHDFLYLMHEFIVVLKKSTTSSKDQIQLLHSLSKKQQKSTLFSAGNYCHHVKCKTYCSSDLRSKKGRIGSIWIFEKANYTKYSQYNEIFERFVACGTSMRLYSDESLVTDIKPKKETISSLLNAVNKSLKKLSKTNVQYENIRNQAIERNLKLVSELSIDNTSPLSSPYQKSMQQTVSQIASVIVIDLIEIEADSAISFVSTCQEKLNFCINNCQNVIPHKGYFIIHCKDVRFITATNSLLCPTALIIWDYMEHVKDKLSLHYKDILITVPAGYEKHPKANEYDLTDLSIEDIQSVELPIVHEYFLIYQVDIG